VAAGNSRTVRRALAGLLATAAAGAVIATAPAAASADTEFATRTDVSAQLGGGTPLPASNGVDIVGWVTPWDLVRHVAYLTDAGQVVEVRTVPGSRTWGSVVVTDQAGVRFARNQATLSAYAYGFDQSSHIIVSDARDGHVHELWTSARAPGWHDADLTVATGVKLSAAGFARGFATGLQQHVVFTSGMDIWELTYSPGSGFKPRNISAAVPTAPKPAWGFPVTGIAVDLFSRAIAYIGTDKRVHYLTQSGSAWSEDTRVAATAVVADPFVQAFSMLAGVSNGQPHVGVQYIAANRDVHQVASFNGLWFDIDLTKATGGPFPNAINFYPNSAVSFAADGSDRLFMFCNFAVHEFVRTATNFWSRRQVTENNSSAIVIPVGFSAPDNAEDTSDTMYVAYLSRANHLMIMEATATHRA
jgi:hypothetical protein